MLERKTVVDQIEITRHGVVQVRLALLVMDGDVEVSRKWHRTVLPTDVPNGAVLQMAEVNRHLAEMGEAPLEQGCLDKCTRADTLCREFVVEDKARKEAKAPGKKAK